MGAKQTKHHGTDFKENQRKRRQDGSCDDIPVIPFIKQKKINEGLCVIIRDSIWFANYKRAFRGYLRANPQRAQEGVFLRIHRTSLADADLLGLAKDSHEALIDHLVGEIGGLWSADCRDSLKERGKIHAKMNEVEIDRKINGAIADVFLQMAETFVMGIGKKIYEKYNRGADFEMSDTDMDPETKRRLDEQRQERIRKEAEEREREAAEWKVQADMEAMLHEARVSEAKLKEQTIQIMEKERVVSPSRKPASPVSRKGRDLPPAPAQPVPRSQTQQAMDARESLL
jgi:hypothetical protein